MTISSIPTADELAQFFHETYERLAPDHGYETREASAKPWADVPEQNKGLMIAVAEAVLARIIGANRSAAGLYRSDWWSMSRERLDSYVYDVVRFGFAAENDGLAADEVAVKIQDWADTSSGPSEIVYTAAARALAEPPPEDPTTLDRRVPRVFVVKDEITIKLCNGGPANYRAALAKIPSISEAEAKRAAAAFRRELHRPAYGIGIDHGAPGGDRCVYVWRVPPARPQLPLAARLAFLLSFPAAPMSIGRRRWLELHPQQRADMLASWRSHDRPGNH